ncbi:MAG: GNAT family N-acetyltransferase [Alphaproteobacteria bacterium]
MINIRKEQPADYAAVYELVKQAFEHAEHTDHNEHNLVNRLRQSPFYLPELALVAETGGIIVGHIMFTETRVGDSRQLLLAPLSVLPEYQNCGIGSALIKEGHRKAKELGYEYCFLVGHAGYYPRFGYVRASALGVTCSLEFPDENIMVCDLQNQNIQLNASLTIAQEFFA